MFDNIKILTCGRLAKEFKTELTSFAEVNKFLIDHLEDFDQKKIYEYNTIASFSFPDNLDISHIKWIHSFGAGIDKFINRNDLNNNLILTRTVGRMGEKIAEYCLTHILAHNQHLYEVYESQKLKEWKRLSPVQINDNKIAILGTGNMGRDTARLLNKFGCDIIGINSDGRPIDKFSQCYSFEQLAVTERHDQVVAAGLDTLICTLPAAPGTKNLLTQNFFSQFTDLHFINVGRGVVVSEETIISAVENGNISRATLDVFVEEPLPSSSKLWDNDRVFITPHQASLTDINDVIESFQSVYDAIKRNKRNNLFVDLVKGY
ncbi:NAD(P)-dependent oxidoreductase [Bacteroidota bacterium]